MKLSINRTDVGPVVPVQETRAGLLYRYDFKDESLYLIATVGAANERIFVDLVRGDPYYGDQGTLRLLDQAELILGRKSK